MCTLSSSYRSIRRGQQKGLKHESRMLTVAFHGRATNLPASRYAVSGVNLFLPSSNNELKTAMNSHSEIIEWLVICENGKCLETSFSLNKKEFEKKQEKRKPHLGLSQAICWKIKWNNAICITSSNNINSEEAWFFYQFTGAINHSWLTNQRTCIDLVII